MNRISNNRWLMLGAVLLAVWLMLQLNMWRLLLIMGLLSLSACAALRQIRAL